MDCGPEYRKWWVGVQLRVENINHLHARLKRVTSFLEGKRMVKIAQKDAQALFTALGHAKVENWSDQRLQDKVEGLKDFAEEEGDDLPKLKGKEKKTFDTIISAIDDEEEIDVVPTVKDEDDDEDEDEDVQDSEDEDGDDLDDADEELAGEEEDEEDEPDEEDEEEEEDEDETPAPARKVEAREEFVGIKELVAVLTRIANQLEGYTVPSGEKTVSTKPSANGKTSFPEVVKLIRGELAHANSADKAVDPIEVAAKVAEKASGWSKGTLKHRVLSQLTKRMPKDGFVVKKASGGKFWVKKK